MKTVATKVSGNTYTAEEFTNGVSQEAQNSILNSGQVLNESDLFQASKAMAINAAGSDFYVDSGTANTLVLAPVGNKQAPPAYFNGQRISGFIGVTNTGATTVNVSGVGTVPLKFKGNPLTSNFLSAGDYFEARHDSGDASFEIIKVGQYIESLAPINVKDFGAIGDGVTDDTASVLLATALSELTGRSLYFPTGTYIVSTQSDFTKSIVIHGDGDGTVLDVTGLTASDEGIFRFSGTQTQIENLSVNVSEGGFQVTFASAPSLVVGGVFQIFNPTPSSWSTARTNYFAGEFCQVSDIAGNVVTLTNPLYDSYNFADVDIYVLGLIAPVVKDMKIIGDAGFSVLHYDFCTGTLYNNLNLFNKNNSLIALVKCYQVRGGRITGHNVGDGGDDYGISVGNSQDMVTTSFSDIFARRHAVTLGGDTAVGAVPCRNVRTTYTTLKNDPALSLFAADMHGNCEDCSYDYCNIYSAVTWQGKNNGYSYCKIWAWADGVCLETSEIKGGLFYLRYCDYFIYKDPQLTTRGIIDLGGNSNSITADAVEDITIEVTGGRMFGRNLGASTSVILMKNRGTTKKINFDVQGLKLDLDNFGSLITTELVSGTADSAFMIADNITTPLNGRVLFNHQANDYEPFPHRCQMETGSETVTVTSGTFFKLGTTFSYHWGYPKKPHISMSRTNKGALGARLGTAYGETAVSALSFTPAIASDDNGNFTVTGDVDLNWIIGIKEI